MAGLSEADRVLCDFAVKLTLRPGAMQKSDIETLHAYGFDDDQITIATQVIGYFNYINRIADGLGVDPEDWRLCHARSGLLTKPATTGSRLTLSSQVSRLHHEDR